MPPSTQSSRAPRPPATRAADSPHAPGAREAAARALTDQAARFPDLLPLGPQTDGLSQRDAALAHAIYDASIRHWLALEHILSGFLRHPFHSHTPPLQAVLLAGAAQILLLDRIPAHAALNESVNLAKRMVRGTASGLTNAVLRRVAKLRGPAVPRPSDWLLRRDLLPLGDGRARRLNKQALPKDPLQRLCVLTSHPHWLLERWGGMLASERAIALALHSLMPAPTILNTSFAKSKLPPHLIKHHSAGHHIHAGTRAELSELLSKRSDLWVQDPASSKAVEAARHLAPRLIVDLCAGQGTKTRQLAAAFPEARILATDTDPARFETLTGLWRGHGRVQVMPIAQVRSRANGRADLVLLDVPCSNSGVLARRVEAKYRLSHAQIARLMDLQAQIINEGVLLLAPGGRLLYSTCSLEPEENEHQSQAAAQRHGLALEHSALTLPAGVPGDSAENYHDGAYIALLAR